MLEIHQMGVRSSPGGSENGSNSPVQRRRSLPSGATSFVSLVESDSDGVDLQNFANRQLRADLCNVDARLSGVIGQKMHCDRRQIFW